jgi:uncharacterized protein involved in exopolysaccharide biosynthesis
MSTSVPGPVVPSPARQATMREFFAVLFRRRWLVLGLFAAVTATVLVIAISTPTRYESSGRVLVTRGERESALTGRVQLLNDWEQDLAGEVAKVRSTQVIGRTREILADRARRAGRPAPLLAPGGLDVEVLGKSNVLAIGYSDLDPKVARQVCDALITAYVEYRQDKNVAATDTLFANEMKSIDARIEAALAQRQQVAVRAGVSDATDQSRALLSQVSVIEQTRDTKSSELAGAETSLHIMREMTNNPAVDLPATDGNISDENALHTLKDRITLQQATIATLRERYRDDAPEVQNAMATLETLQALLRKEIDTRLAIAQNRIDVLKSQIADLNRSLVQLHARLDNLPADQRSLEDLDAEIKTLRSRNEEYVKARDQARITANVSSPITVTLLNPAGAAVARNTLDLVRLALAPGFSIVVGIGLAFFIDGLDITVRTASQAEEYLELPVLATLPERRVRRG